MTELTIECITKMWNDRCIQGPSGEWSIKLNPYEAHDVLANLIAAMQREAQKDDCIVALVGAIDHIHDAITGNTEPHDAGDIAMIINRARQKVLDLPCEYSAENSPIEK